MKKHVAIIGAGLGGLSCGIHLLTKGFGVKIYEKNPRTGGRANLHEEKGFKIDMGPTLILMPEVLERVFIAAGKRMSDYLQLKELDPGYRIFFADGRRFDMTHDLSKIITQVSYYAMNREKHFFKYLEDVREKFNGSRDRFIERSFDSFWDILHPRSLEGFLRIKPFGNAYGHVNRYFRNPYLATAFSCQTLYLGYSPFRVPALYNLLAYLEFTYGVWYPEGGMHRVPEALTRLFLELGGVLQLNSEVDSIAVENGKAKGVRLKDGTIELSDAVVSNRDLPASYYHFVDSKFRKSVTDKKIRQWRYGCSCVMVYLGMKKKIKGLFHHNILISGNFRRSCEQIFSRSQLPKEPLIYVCAPTKTDPTLAPPGQEVVYILGLVPNLKKNSYRPDGYRAFVERVFDRMERSGIQISSEDIDVERVFTPEDFESEYGSFYGNAFGLAPAFFQSAVFRPRTKSKDVSGLYHTGASTHPGGGVPMVLISGRLVAGQIERDLGFSGSVRLVGGRTLRDGLPKL